MYEFHGDNSRYFEIQLHNAEKHIIPFIDKAFPIRPDMRVLEIGCGMGAVLKAFMNKGCTCVGVELEEARVEYAKDFLATEFKEGKVSFVAKDIYLVDVQKELGGRFDIIVLKDVIEHIHDQTKLIAWMKDMLTPGGVIFFGFPPWQMPFGGHQQMCHHKWLAKLPYYHLLPAPVYRALLRKFDEPVDGLMEIKETGISIERFESITRRTGYRIVEKLHYLINPVYEWKFGLKPRAQLPVIRSIPYLRNYFTTCVYYLITPGGKS